MGSEKDLEEKMRRTEYDHTSEKTTQETKEMQKPTFSFSANWLAILSVLCFVLASTFIIKLAYDSGQLTPERQVICAALFGGALVACGFLFLKRLKEYAYFLPTAGVVILYITNAGGFIYYHLYSVFVSMVLVSLISTAAIVIFRWMRREIFPIVAAIGTYSSPFLSDLGEFVNFHLCFLLVCTVVFASIAILIRSRRVMAVCAYFSVLANAAWLESYSGPSEFLSFIFPLHFLVLFGATILLTRKKEEFLSQRQSWILFPALVMFYSVEAWNIHRLNPSILPWVSLCFSLFLLAAFSLYRRACQPKQLNSGKMVFTYSTLIFLYSIYSNTVLEANRVWLLPIVIVLSLFFFLKGQDFFKSEFIFALVFMWLAFLYEFLKLIYAQWFLNEFYHSIPVSLVTIALLFVFYFWKVKSQQREYVLIYLSMSHFLLISTLYQLFKEHGSLPVSISWLSYGVLILIASFWQKNKTFAHSSLLVLLIAAGKALLYDVFSTGLQIRIICLIMTGFVLYVCGFLFKKIKGWEG